MSLDIWALWARWMSVGVTNPMATAISPNFKLFLSCRLMASSSALLVTMPFSTRNCPKNLTAIFRPLANALNCMNESDKSEFPQNSQDVVGFERFRNDIFGAKFKRFGKLVTNSAERCHHDNLDLFIHDRERAQCGETVHAGHVHVHADNLRIFGMIHLDRLGAVLGVSDTGEVA